MRGQLVRRANDPTNTPVCVKSGRNITGKPRITNGQPARLRPSYPACSLPKLLINCELFCGTRGKEFGNPQIDLDPTNAASPPARAPGPCEDGLEAHATPNRRRHRTLAEFDAIRSHASRFLIYISTSGEQGVVPLPASRSPATDTAWSATARTSRTRSTAGRHVN